MIERRPIVGGNWKMNTSRIGAKELCQSILEGFNDRTVDTEVILYPPYMWLTDARDLMNVSSLKLGAQDGLAQENGAITGGVNLTMLSEVVDALLVGHSERRSIFHETAEKFSQQLIAGLDFGLVTTYCVGENQAQQEAGLTYQVLTEQIASVFTGANGVQLSEMVHNNPSSFVIAYEPIWAIGTGLVAEPENVQQRAEYIRSEISRYCDASELIRIQYGGSVNQKNAAEFAELVDIDGALVGGASLDPQQFLHICDAFSTNNR